MTFKESAEQFGIADTGWTSQSVFFDFDNDGDLDLYVMNHANEWLSKKDGPSKNDVAILSKDHLYRNDNNLFVDVSKSAGLIEEKFGGFGLGIAIADINLDGYQDIYISSDYDSPDLLYINQGNSTFKEEAKQRFGHISYFSMGVDIAD
ncbi:MAG: FG-GAP repeat domain-containing protein, partial [Salibacteraceae bacterium]